MKIYLSISFTLATLLVSCSSSDTAPLEASETLCTQDACDLDLCMQVPLSRIDKEKSCAQAYQRYCTREIVFWLDEGLERTSPIILQDDVGNCWYTLSTRVPIEVERATIQSMECGAFVSEGGRLPSCNELVYKNK